MARWNEGHTRRGVLASLALAAALLTGSPTLSQDVKAPPDVTAKSVFVVNADTGKVLYEKNPDEVFRILSLTKLVTAYILVDQMGDRLAETVTINWPHLAGGSSAELKRRDVWSLQDLLYGMILVSGNDASLAIADGLRRPLRPVRQECRNGAGYGTDRGADLHGRAAPARLGLHRAQR